MGNKARIMTPKEAYTTDYPEVIELVERQMEVLWGPEEFKVEKDVQDILVNMTEAERHGVITTLKLFTLYELHLGDEYWGDVIKKMFPRPEIIRMCAVFSHVELGVHSPFYAKINQALNLDTDEFYTSYADDPVLKERIEMLEECVNPEKPFDTLAALAMAEGVILYSNFAFLRHFQAQGKSKLPNIVAGIAMSVNDEAIHADASLWLCRTLRDEMGGYYPEGFEERVHKLARTVHEHECAIIDKIFERGEIEGITAEHLKAFVESRINMMLRGMELSVIDFGDKPNPIAGWFYKTIGGYTSPDFFARLSSNYVRTWPAGGFVWRNEE